MTERLYLQDPYLKAFRARVLEVRDFDGKPAAVLDRCSHRNARRRAARAASPSWATAA